jgi:hypothetical protein
VAGGARLARALARLDELRGDPRHRIGEPASPEAIAALEADFPDLEPELVEIYRFANGFSLFADSEDFELLPIAELSRFRDAVADGSYNYVLHGDPDRVRAFYAGNGNFYSYSRLGFSDGAWLDDYREGIKATVAGSVVELLELALNAAASDGALHLIGAFDLPEGYGEALAELDAAERGREQAAFADEPTDPASDWSDLAASMKAAAISAGAEALGPRNGPPLAFDSASARSLALTCSNRSVSKSISNPDDSSALMSRSTAVSSVFTSPSARAIVRRLLTNSTPARSSTRAVIAGLSSRLTATPSCGRSPNFSRTRAAGSGKISAPATWSTASRTRCR